jgi:hypothetical protein
MRRGSFNAATRSRGVSALRGWNAAVLASAAIVVLVALATGIGWLVSLHSGTANYSVSAPLARVDLQLHSGQAVIVGSSSSTIQVRRTDHYSFGHSARERRFVAGGVLHISSRCPRILLGSCSASYELAVPETVAVNVNTTDGRVRLTGFRGSAVIKTGSGNVDVEAYCGFDVAARSGSGDVHVAAACAPQRLDVRSGSGDAVALVPPGRYRISALSGVGRERVTGLLRDARAPFTIDAHSGSGSVAVEGGL